MLERLEASEVAVVPSLKFEFLTAAEYRKDLYETAKNAGELVVLQAMSFAHDEATGPILESVLQARKEARAHAIVLPDEYSRLYAEEGFRWSHRSKHRRTVKTQNTIMSMYMGELRAARGHARYIHPYMGRGRRLNTFPLAGRNHAKISRVDDVVWTFGGVNFTDMSFSNHDYMLRAESSGLARLLTAYAKEHLADGRTVRSIDIEQRLDEENTLLIDVGVPGQSVIYKKAIELTKDADGSILFVSQFAPEGKLKKELKRQQAQLGSEQVRAVFNAPDNFSFPVNIEQRLIPRLGGLRHETIAEGYVHAKFMIFRYADGRRYVLSGSNNFNQWGVRFGTAEIALLSSNSELINKFEAYAESLPVHKVR